MIKAYKKNDLQAYNGLQAYERFKAYKNYTKKSSKKDATINRFLHSCNFRLIRGLEHSNVKLMLNIDIANRVVNDYLTITKKNYRKRCRENDGLFCLQRINKILSSDIWKMILDNRASIDLTYKLHSRPYIVIDIIICLLLLLLLLYAYYYYYYYFCYYYYYYLLLLFYFRK